MDDKAKGSATYPGTSFRKGVVAAANAYGNNREIQIVGKNEGSTFEGTYLARERACALGKNCQRATFSQDAVGLAQRGSGSSAVPIHIDEAGALARVAEDGDAAQLLFHHPFDVVPQVAFHQEDVEKALMVGNEDVFLVRINVFASLYLDRKEKQLAEKPSPSPGNDGADDAASENGAENDDKDGGDERADDHHRKCNEVLPNEIEDFHWEVFGKTYAVVC